MDSLDAIEKRAREALARAEKATARLWQPMVEYIKGLNVYVAVGPRHMIDEHGCDQVDADAAFIASARTDVPLLAADALALVERLRKAEAVIDAARPLGAAIFLDVCVSDEARFQVRRAVDAYDAFLAKREAP